MENTIKVIAYLLAKLISTQTGESVDSLLEEAVAATTNGEAPGDEIDKAAARIYDLYPTKCPMRCTSTGKCAKNKTQIKALLKNHSEAELTYTIKRYVDECTKYGSYLKNFSTFLNQLPDYSDDLRLFDKRKEDTPQQ